MPFISLVKAMSATMLALIVPLDPEIPTIRLVPVSENPPSVPKQYPLPKGNPGLWVSPNDYPLTALAKKAEGTTGFRALIDKNGDVKDCAITQSSGDADLDAATCIKIFIRAKFIPAKDETGAAIAGNWSSRIRWQIPKGTAESAIDIKAAQGTPTGRRQEPLSPGSVQVTFTLKADGSIVDCATVLEGAFLAQQGQNSQFCENIATSKFEPVVDENGKALDRRVIMKTELKVEIVK